MTSKKSEKDLTNVKSPETSEPDNNQNKDLDINNNEEKTKDNDNKKPTQEVADSPPQKEEGDKLDANTVDKMEVPPKSDVARATNTDKPKTDTPIKKGKAKDKSDKKSKIQELISKYKLPLIIILAVILVAAVITTTVLVVNAPKVFVRGAEDFILKENSKKKIYILKKDITIDGDLELKNDLDINLNKKTLTVNGTFKLTLDDSKTSTINIGTLKKKNYINGGKIIADSIDISAGNISLNVFSPLFTNGTIKVKDLSLHEKLEIPDNTFLEISSADIAVKKEVKGTLKLFTSNLDLFENASIDCIIADEYSNAQIYGDIIDSIIGGNEISILQNANCPHITNAKELYYQSQTATVENADNIGTIHIVRQLSTPSQINIEKEGNSFYCISSQVLNADLYIFTIKDGNELIKELESESNKIDITAYIKHPKTYTISAQASSTNKRINIPSDKKEIEYKYSIKLDSPILDITETSEKKIILSFPSIDFATIYRIDINGEVTKELEATDKDYMSMDLTNDIVDIGAYYIKVSASNPSNAAFSDSDTVMTSYLKTIKLDTPIVSISDSGNNIVLSWEKVDDASNYIIRNSENDVAIMTTHTSYVFSKNDMGDGTIFTLYAQGKDYYITSEEVSITFEYPQLGVPTTPQYEIIDNNLVITTDKVTNATNYVLFVNGDRVAQSSTPKFTVADYENGDTIKIKAETKYYRSATSAEVTIEINDN